MVRDGMPVLTEADGIGTTGGRYAHLMRSAVAEPQGPLQAPWPHAALTAAALNPQHYASQATHA